ncbi:MAG: DUF6620 family protein [Sphingobacterium sp.]
MFKKLIKKFNDKVEDFAKDAMKTQLEKDTSEQPSANYGQEDMQKIFDMGTASVGVKTMNTATEDPNDPLLAPVHGLTIGDYAAGAYKIGEGCTADEVSAALGVERPIWDEVQTTWNNRMRDDTSYNLVNVYSKHFGQAKEHPKFATLVPSNKPQTDVLSEDAKATLERLETDKHYFFEIQGALEAAYANGMDGAQWLIDNLGLSVGQVNGAGTKYMNDFSVMAQMMAYQEQKKNEYNEQFKKENGAGGVVDDIDF